VQVFLALLVHRAVAVVPTVRQLTARFSRISGVGEVVTMDTKVKIKAVEKNIVDNDVQECQFSAIPIVLCEKLLYIAIDKHISMDRL
jgi:hypothetical protein